MSRKNQNTAKVEMNTSDAALELPASQVEALVEETKEVVTEVVIPHTIEELTTKFKTKSAIVRFLDSEGHKRGAIAKFLNIRYQHVRNILVTPIKKDSELVALVKDLGLKVEVTKA